MIISRFTVNAVTGALLCLMACGTKETRPTSIDAGAGEYQPHYRRQASLALYVSVPPALEKVRGIRQYIRRQIGHTNRRLGPQFGLQLYPIFAPPQGRALSIRLKTDSSTHTTSAVGYGQFQFEGRLTVEDVAQSRSESFARALYPAVLQQLGIPAPCLDDPSFAKGLSILRFIVNRHLSRHGQRVHITSTPLSSVAKDILHQLNQTSPPPGCMSTLIGREQIRLWEDVNTQLQSLNSDVPQFLYEAHVALSDGDFEKAYSLCGPEAERRPQTGSARCAAQAAQGLANYQEASRMWRAHLAFFPDDQPGIIALARCIGRQGDDDSARAILQLNVNRFPEWLDAQIELGIALYRLNKPKRARARWQGVLESDPMNADALRLLRQY